MWTPKRIGLLVVGFAVFAGAYGVYAHFLGAINGLPPLPEAYLPNETLVMTPEPPAQPRQQEVDRKLRMAFGEDCEELSRSIRFEVRNRGMALSAGAIIFEKNGDVSLSPISLALFGKTVGPAGVPEINTVRAKDAILTFDRPIRNPMDMEKAKLLKAQLGKDQQGGEVFITNNRRTLPRDDDITIVTPGPIYFDEAKRLVWTNNVVTILDHQCKPEPMKIDSTGLQLFLSTETAVTAAAPPAQAKPPRRKGDAITGVEHIVLLSGVKMDLWVDGRSGFLASGKPALPTSPTPGGKTPNPPVPPPETAKIVITTAGPFSYDMAKDIGQFDAPPKKEGLLPDPVQVTRIHEPAEAGKRDHLECDHLLFQFHRRSSTEPKKDDRSVELEIESVHATGENLTITSDAEMLTAYGNDLFYDNRTRQTTLKGDQEMVAIKEGNEIHARELQLIDQKGAQQATALGPGRIDMLDKTTGKRTQHAIWKDTLISGRDGTLDLLILTGEAVFKDDEHDQDLRADTLRVWLEPAQPGVNGQAPHGRTPHHIEAISRVAARSKEMIIHDTDRLQIRFVPAPAGTQPTALIGPPSILPQAAPPVGALPQGPSNLPIQPLPANPKPQKPIDLSAHLVEAEVCQVNGKNELLNLRTEGTVRVTQEPSAPDEKGVKIEGETLRLTHYSTGNVLVVTGDRSVQDLAMLQLNSLVIIGPEVNIDQTNNKAWVNGTGLMVMESSSDFQGNKLNRPVPLKVIWNKEMFFKDNYASFQGGVQAEQESGKLTCQSLQVYFDKPISLKEGEKTNEPKPKAKELICDQSVQVEDENRVSGKLVRWQHIQCPALKMDTDESTAQGGGPGVVRLLQHGNSATLTIPAAPTAKKAPTPPEQLPLKLIEVKYVGRMNANNKKHLAEFYDTIEVLNVPVEKEDVHLAIDKNNLPPCGMYLQCERKLEVYSRDVNGAANQSLRAIGKVFFRARDEKGKEVYGTAEELKYSQEKDQVILDGGSSGMATLNHVTARGAPPSGMKARQLIYNLKTGAMNIADGTDFSGSVIGK
jgi:lipopolysaccharide export system protein LptA